MVHCRRPGREADDQVARPIARVGAEPGHAQRRALRHPVELQRHQRCIGRDDDDDRALVGRRLAGEPFRRARLQRAAAAAAQLRVEAGQPALGQCRADRRAGDPQHLAVAGVALDEHADRMGFAVDRHDARCGADAALEAEADHAGPAADIAFLDRPRLGRVERRQRTLGRHVKALDVAQIAAPRLGHDRPGRFAEFLRAPLLDRRIDLPDGIGVADPDRALDDPEILEIGAAGHFAVAVEVEKAAVDRTLVGMAAREHDRDSRPDVLAFDHRHLPDLDSGNVGDRVERARRALERDAKIARPRVGLRRDERQREQRQPLHFADTSGSSRGTSNSGVSSSSRAHLWPV